MSGAETRWTFQGAAGVTTPLENHVDNVVPSSEQPNSSATVWRHGQIVRP